jgi:vacuolar protein sorting-associated protein 13B
MEKQIKYFVVLGELSFTNLDLNLEVLDQELDISPFSFSYGKIEKLSVSVPWTKIASEPIVISINTMGE